MALNISQLKSRLNSLQNQGSSNKDNIIWKPKPGKQIVRIVPYKFNPENPFIELKFHYNINGKTYLSPDSFGRPDPIVEFANRLKRTGSKEDWQMGRKMEPKMRTFAPIIVRGEEHEGVKFWGFGKTVYQEIGALILDGEYGDITDLLNGRDLTVDFKPGEETGKSYPVTAIRPRPNVSPAVDPNNTELMESLKNQSNLLDLFPELSYDQLKDVMDSWLNPEQSEESESSEATNNAESEDEDNQAVAATSTVSKPVKSPTATKAKANLPDDVSKAFDDLFNS
jgi:hypothetical protein